MWAIDNGTQYAADGSWVRDKDGAHHWVVVVKATFDLDDKGGLTIADEQLDPLIEPEYSGEPGASSLRYEADLVPPKPNTDVTVNAHAHAPGGKPARSVEVSLGMKGVRKTLLVHGSRVYRRRLFGLSTSRPDPFVSKPINYESAYGGTDATGDDPRKHAIDARNPVGKGVAARRAIRNGTEAHSIEYVGGRPAKAGPAGFGAIASHWSPRFELAGTYDADWDEHRKPLLPTDYDDRFLLHSPTDQRPSTFLRGGEIIELINLSPAGTLRIALPKIYFAFSTWFGSKRTEHRAKLASVVIEPEDGRLISAWQTSIRVMPKELDYLDRTSIREKPFLS